MADEFSDQRLPDLPTAGYATQRQKLLTDAIMQFMRECERDRLRLLNIVLHGLDTWRSIAADVWRGTGIDTELIDEIYKYFTLQAARPADQRELLKAAQNPAKWRDIVKRIQPDLEAQREQLRTLAKWSPYTKH